MVQFQPEDLRIDVTHTMSFICKKAKQFDHNSRIYRLIITNNNIPIPFSGNELIMLSLTADGDNYANETCKFGEDKCPYIKFTEHMLSRIGEIDCGIKIFDSSNPSVLSTFNFKLRVENSLLDQDRIISSSEFNILNDLIIQANTIPDLIIKFGLSQDEINNLIEKIKKDIESYTSQFSEMKTTYTNDFQSLISKINSDITNYQIEFNSLKNDINVLKTEIVTWYTEAKSAETIRISNETLRQTNTANAINNCETATEKTENVIKTANTATNAANEAGSYALAKGLYAEGQGNRVEQALQDFEFRLRTIDGGNLTDTTPSENLFDGGTL